jgi:hypothetical protein
MLLGQYRAYGLNKVRDSFLRSACTEKYVTVYHQLLSSQ